jgi:hypothetical protein
MDKQFFGEKETDSTMKRITRNAIIPSAAYSVPHKLVKAFIQIPERVPQIGDLVYGEIVSLGFHTSLESISARIHTIHHRTRAVFVFGNRYAPDHYEGLVPEKPCSIVDMLARSGIVGEMKNHNELIASPTRVKILGYVCDQERNVVNTSSHVLIKPKRQERTGSGARIILCVGTAMNSGKSYAAAACCYALSAMEKRVRAAKITGTASLKDVLLMQDCGAQKVVDFTFFGHPSTYMLGEEELLGIFHSVDMKYGNNPRNYLVLEFADGIFQRETEMLLKHPLVQKRIHKLVLCASDAAGVSGGLGILRDTFSLVPDAISGVCSSSPLAIREIRSFSDIPILKSIERDYKAIYSLIK